MSKSKLNRRQLKKISKLAMDAVVNFHGVRNLPDFGFCKESGEHFFWYSTYFGECDEVTSCEDLMHLFSNAWDYMNEWVYVPLSGEYHSLSFANRIHYMIEFLEASNEQG